MGHHHARLSGDAAAPRLGRAAAAAAAAAASVHAEKHQASHTHPNKPRALSRAPQSPRPVCAHALRPPPRRAGSAASPRLHPAPAENCTSSASSASTASPCRQPLRTRSRLLDGAAGGYEPWPGSKRRRCARFFFSFFFSSSSSFFLFFSFFFFLSIVPALAQCVAAARSRSEPPASGLYHVCTYLSTPDSASASASAGRDVRRRSADCCALARTHGGHGAHLAPSRHLVYIFRFAVPPSSSSGVARTTTPGIVASEMRRSSRSVPPPPPGGDERHGRTAQQQTRRREEDSARSQLAAVNNETLPRLITATIYRHTHTDEGYLISRARRSLPGPDGACACVRACQPASQPASQP